MEHVLKRLGPSARAVRHQLWFGASVSLVILALVLSPAFRDPNQDSFPLSTYPMFSHPKPNPDLVLTQVLAVFPNGDRKPLPPKLATGNEEVIQAMRMILSETYGGDKRATRFCHDVAYRIERASTSPWKDAVAVELARSHFDSVAYFEKAPTPVNRRMLQRCAIER